MVSRCEIGKDGFGFENLCYLLCLGAHLAYNDLNMKVLVGAFNQEKALVEAFSVVCDCENFADGSFAVLL